MILRVNKHTGAKRAVHYAALSTGTIGDVWCNEDSALSAPKRLNRIKMTREKTARPVEYDA